MGGQSSLFDLLFFYLRDTKVNVSLSARYASFSQSVNIGNIISSFVVI